MLFDRVRRFKDESNRPPISGSSSVMRVPGVAAETIDEVTAVMSVEKGSYFLIEGTGNAIWNRLEGTVSVSALCTDLAKEFAVDRTTCEIDVVEFLSDLQVKGLVQVVEP